MPSITPHLWFEKDVFEAAEYYCSIFPNSRIHDKATFENTGPDRDMTVRQVDFEINGQKVICLEAGPEFKLDEAFSFFVEVDTQEEVDDYWAKLTAGGGEPGPCGWLKDKYGVSWQIIPTRLMELMQDEDPAKANAVMKAMLQMGKIEIDDLEKAAANA